MLQVVRRATDCRHTYCNRRQQMAGLTSQPISSPVRGIQRLLSVFYQYAGPSRYYFVLKFSLIPAAAQGVSDLLHNVTGYRVLYERDVIRIEDLQKDGSLTV
jgi:hypothetical protein